MTTLQILETGELTGNEPTHVLEETLAVAEFQLTLFTESRASARLDRIVKHLTALTAQILHVLNRRRGADGMTPVQL